MAILSTCLSTSRPSPGVHGDLLLETDTKSLAMYDSAGGWHSYGRTGFQWNNSPAGQLTYPNGVYSTPGSGTYDINVQPIVHLDARMLDGVNVNTTPIAGDRVMLWSDRSGNTNNFRFSGASATSAPAYNMVNSQYPAVDWTYLGLGHSSPLHVSDAAGYTSDPNWLATDQGGAIGYDPNLKVSFPNSDRTEIILQSRVAQTEINTGFRFNVGGNGSSSFTYGTDIGGPCSYGFCGSVSRGIPTGASAHSRFMNVGYHGLSSDPPSDWGVTLTDAESVALANNQFGPDMLFTLLIAVQSGTSGQLYQNGNYLIADKTVAFPNDSYYSLGGMDWSNWPCFHELITFDSALGAAELNEVLAYLQNKYPLMGQHTGLPNF